MELCVFKILGSASVCQTWNFLGPVLETYKIIVLELNCYILLSMSVLSRLISRYDVTGVLIITGSCKGIRQE